MSTFINLNIDKSINGKFLVRHLLYSLLWLSGILILIFRIDLSLANLLPNKYKWIINVIPLIFFSIVLIIMFIQKWYFNLAFILYPFLIFFWFLPKFILANGKIYLFLNYINYLFDRFKKFKSCLGHLGLFFLTIFPANRS
jgi:hypothetical protein